MYFKAVLYNFYEGSLRTIHSMETMANLNMYNLMIQCFDHLKLFKIRSLFRNNLIKTKPLIRGSIFCSDLREWIKESCFVHIVFGVFREAFGVVGWVVVCFIVLLRFFGVAFVF